MMKNRGDVEGPDRLTTAAQGRFRSTVRTLLRNRSAILGLTILSILTFVAIFAPYLTKYDPVKPLIGVEKVEKRAPPCIHLLGCPRDQPQHLFGIDGNVRDVFSRVLYGARLSLIIGFSTVGFAIVIGTILGLISGYLGGWVDNVIMRVMDVLLAFPSLLLAIAIGIVSIPTYARVVRANVLLLKEMDFVTASRALGADKATIMLRHILPNTMTPLIVYGTLGIATAILDAAALSFIGLGAQPPVPEWGLMLAQHRNLVFTAPHLVFFPGLAIMITVLSFNLLGDGLRDAIDPRLKQG